MVINCKTLSYLVENSNRAIKTVAQIAIAGNTVCLQLNTRAKHLVAIISGNEIDTTLEVASKNKAI